MATKKEHNCPGWKAYFTSLEPEQQEELRKKYNFNKY